MKAKAKAEEKHKDLAKSRDHCKKVAKKHQKDLGEESEKAVEHLQRVLNHEEESRHLKVQDNFPAEVKTARHEASNNAYIIVFANVVWIVHQPDLDLSAVQTKMREMLVSYMHANPVKPDAQLPLFA